MRRAIIAVLPCIVLTSCAVVDCHRPPETVMVRVAGKNADGYTLRTTTNTPSSVRVVSRTGSTFALALPEERYGGMLMVFIPIIWDPEDEWFLDVMLADRVVRTLSVSRVRKLKEVDGVRTIKVRK